MKKAILVSLTIACGLSPDVIPAATAADSSQGFAFTDKVVLAYYYIWFQEDNWLKPAASGGRREGLAGLQPLVGAYHSWDPTIIDKHMSQMNRALIDALAVSWWYDRGRLWDVRSTTVADAGGGTSGSRRAIGCQSRKGVYHKAPGFRQTPGHPRDCGGLHGHSCEWPCRGRHKRGLVPGRGRPCCGRRDTPRASGAPSRRLDLSP